MAKLLKLRRGTTSQHSSFTGAGGEVTIDTDKDTAVVHDGSTAAGRALAREDLNNVASASITGRLATGSIARAKIADDAIDGTKIDDDAIDSEHYVTGSIDAAHIANDTITGTQIAPNAIGQSELAANAVTAAHIADGTVVAADLAADSVTSSEIAANAVGASELADDAVDTDAIVNDAVTYAKIQNVSATDRILGRVSSGAGVIEELTPATLRAKLNVEDGATADQTSTEIKSLLASDNLTASHLAANSVGSSELADNAVDRNAIQDNAVNGDKITDGAIDEPHLNITNSGSNGQALTRAGTQFTWATISPDGGNAATLDGIDSASFVRSDADDTVSAHTEWQDNKEARFGADNDMHIFSDNTNNYITANRNHLRLCKSGNNVVIQIEQDGDVWVQGHIHPWSNNTYDLGSSGNRWRNIYTNDLNLSNEGSVNDVDGTWGNYTIQEGEDELFLLNRRNGKKYKFNLTEVH